jgi:hypothetical protein
MIVHAKKKWSGLERRQQRVSVRVRHYMRKISSSASVAMRFVYMSEDSCSDRLLL